MSIQQRTGIEENLAKLSLIFNMWVRYANRPFGLRKDSARIEFDQNTDKARVDELPLVAVLPR